MANYSQANRPMRVETILGEDAVLLTEFAGEEAMSTPFSYTLELLSEDGAIDGKKMLGTPALVTLDLAGGGKRYVHGTIRRFVQLGRTETKLFTYRAEIAPWLWFLSLSSECRIFQGKSVLDIVEEVFKEHALSDFAIRCTKSYPKREFCVQYRETHFNFVSRLLEDEGIFYFFEHTDGGHTLVLADANSAIKPCPDQESARMAAQAGQWQDQDVVTDFEREHAVHTGKITLRDYDYLQPTLQLESSIGGEGAAEAYDYPGHYTKPDEGDHYARVRLEEQETWLQLSHGASTCRAFRSGARFDLKEHHRGDTNQTYMLASVQHSARVGGYRPGEPEAFEYHNAFVALPYNVPFRPPRTARKPVLRGSQTALVVGPSGEEIWTDKYGRVKVQFHWDRVGKKNEDSSCWVRVGSVWAGKGWGFIQIPRIGQEVIVDFLEGDPDHPIITGRVYNAEQMPPYTLPGDQTQSGVKSRSSKGGSGENFNEIRLEDKKGSEQVVIHAEKDMQVTVEDNQSESVGNDETVSIGNNRTESVGKDESISIGKNRTESVGGDEGVTIGGNRSLSASGNESIDVGGKRSDTVGGDEKVSVGGNRSHDIGGNDSLSVGSQLAIDAGSGVTIKTGGATITMKKSGDIQIKGNNIKIEADANIQIKAGNNVTIKGAKVTEN